MRTKHRRWGIGALAALLATMGLMPAGHAAPPEDHPPDAAVGPVDCPEPVVLDEVEVGTTGTGHTVSTGRIVGAFDAEVLGVLEGGIGPDRDLIVVDLSGPAIDAAGGIWSGMSGSPVYVGNRLLGAVAYSMSGSSTLAGLTPAEDMLALLDLPSAGAEAADEGAGADRVALSPEVHARVAARYGERVATNGLERLRLPVSISGLRAERVDYIANAVEDAEFGLALHRGGRAAAPENAEPGTIAGGDNYVAALSYGDVTSAAIGTTTLTCEGSALAFGHPFLFGGAVTQGANAGDAISVVTDPVFGPYKLANIAEPVGTVDQDRMAGLRTVLGAVPSTIPVRSTTTAPDTGNSREGASDIVASADVPTLTPAHLLNSIDVVFDQLGAGSARLSWTVRGTTAAGDEFELERANRYTSESDIAFDSVFELEEQLFAIADNPHTDVEFTGVALDAEVTGEVAEYELGRVETSINGGPFATGEVVASPGDRIRVRATLLAGSEPDRVVSAAVTVPKKATGSGVLAVGNLSREAVEGAHAANEETAGPCLFPGLNCASAEATGGDFEEYLDDLANAPRNDEVRVELQLDGTGGSSAPTDRAPADRVVVGSKFLDVRIAEPH